MPNKLTDIEKEVEKIARLLCSFDIRMNEWEELKDWQKGHLLAYASLFIGLFEEAECRGFDDAINLMLKTNDNTFSIRLQSKFEEWAKEKGWKSPEEITKQINEQFPKMANEMGYVKLSDNQDLPPVGEYAGLYKKQAQEDMLKGDATGVWRKVILGVSK